MPSENVSDISKGGSTEPDHTRGCAYHSALWLNTAMTKAIQLGERHLRHAIDEFVAHCHTERNHQGMGNVIPFTSSGVAAPGGSIRRRERLGGLLNFYERKAA